MLNDRRGGCEHDVRLSAHEPDHRRSAAFEWNSDEIDAGQ